MQNYIRFVFRDIKNDYMNFISANFNLSAFLLLYPKQKLNMNSLFIDIARSIRVTYVFIVEKCDWKI